MSNRQSSIVELHGTSDRPNFAEVQTLARRSMNNSQTRLMIETHDPYRENTYTDKAQVNYVSENTITCSDGQIKLSRLPDDTTGYTNLQGGSYKMPNIVLSIAITPPTAHE